MDKESLEIIQTRCRALSEILVGLSIQQKSFIEGYCLGVAVDAYERGVNSQKNDLHTSDLSST